MSKIRITEIFYSLQGEAKTVGIPTVFVRLTGCPLRCTYCDSAYAFKGGKLYSSAEIIKTIQQYLTRYVTVTGGEPLAQPECLPLLTELCDLNYCVSLETSGALTIKNVDPRVVKIVDFKTPGSKEMSKNDYDNVNYLTTQDQIKIVICDRDDYLWAKNLIEQYQLSQRCEVLLSPSYQQMPNQLLADWIIQDQLPVRFQLQMHKYIWGDVIGK